MKKNLHGIGGHNDACTKRTQRRSSIENLDFKPFAMERDGRCESANASADDIDLHILVQPFHFSRTGNIGIDGRASFIKHVAAAGNTGIQRLRDISFDRA